jgi:hypothetical protein
MRRTGAQLALVWSIDIHPLQPRQELTAVLSGGLTTTNLYESQTPSDLSFMCADAAAVTRTTVKQSRLT